MMTAATIMYYTEYDFNISTMKVCFFNILVLAIILTGCSSKKQSVSNSLIIDSFPRSFLCEEKEVLPITLLDPCEIIVSDSLIIFHLRHEKKLLKAYNRYNFSFIGEILTKGRGPKEISTIGLPGFCQWDVSEGNAKIFIRSYPYQWMWLDMNKSLDSNKTVFSRVYDFKVDIKKKERAQAAGAVFDLGGDSLLIAINPDDYGVTVKNLSQLKYVNLELTRDPNPYFVFYNYCTGISSDSIVQQNFIRTENFSPLIYSGYTRISADHKYLAKVYNYMNMIDFYDVKTKNKKTVMFSPDANDYLKVIQKPITYFNNSSSTEDYLYVLTNTDRGRGNATGSILYMFKWDGTLVCEIKFKERFPYFFVDQKAGELFTIIPNNDDRSSVVKYKIGKYYQNI